MFTIQYRHESRMLSQLVVVTQSNQTYAALNERREVKARKSNAFPCTPLISEVAAVV